MLTPSSRRARSPSGRRCSPSIDAPWAPVQAVEELLDDPQVVANDYIGEVVADGEPVVPAPDACRCSSTSDRRALRRAPEHGEHTELSCSSSATLGRHRRAAGRRG